MDQGTQQNAAMVEQTTAASHALASEAAALSSLLAQFKLAGTNGSAERFAPSMPAQQPVASHAAVRRASPVRPATETARPVPSPARSLGTKIAKAFGGTGAAVKNDPDWTEF
jgi:methyl-accepting chemotaxis protein